MAAVFDENTRYGKVAAGLAKAITHGVYPPGTRIPSVRAQSRSQAVSVSTVLQAYMVLEAQGLIEARPQSGYYVRARGLPAPEPATSRPSEQPAAVTTAALTLQLMRAMENPDCIPFGAAAPDPRFLPTEDLHRLIARASRRDPGQAYSYMLPMGHAGLRLQIARRLHDLGCTVSPEDVLITNGCQEALTLSLRTLTRPGDVVAIESPAFFGTLQAIEILGLQALEIPTHPRDGISLDALALALERWDVRACIVVGNYSNPLGSCLSEPKKLALLKLLGGRGIPLIEDDIYGDLPHAGPRPGLIKAHDRDDQVLLCGSVSKTIGPGLRIGWVVSRRHHENLLRLKAMSTSASASLPQIALADYLASGAYERHLRRIRREYAALVRQISDAVLRHFPAGTCLTQPTGGYVLWVEMPAGVDSLALFQDARLQGISFAPGPIFSATGKYRNCLRLSCTLPFDERAERALAWVGQRTSKTARQIGDDTAYQSNCQ